MGKNKGEITGTYVKDLTPKTNGIDVSAEIDELFDSAAKSYAGSDSEIDGKAVLKEVMKKLKTEQDFELSDGSVLTFDPTEGQFMIDGETHTGNFYLDGEDISAQKALKLVKGELETRVDEMQKDSLDGKIKGALDGPDKNLPGGNLINSPDLFQNLGNKER